MPRRPMASANAAYRPACSPRPWTTANVIPAPDRGHERYAILVPSSAAITPSAATAPAAKMAEAPQDLERLLPGFEQGGGIGSDSIQRVSPPGAGRALRVQPERWWIEEDALAFDLLD